MSGLPSLTLPIFVLAALLVLAFAVGGLFSAAVMTWIHGPELTDAEKSAADAAWGVEHATLLNAALAEQWALRGPKAARAILLELAATLRDRVQRPVI